MKKTWMGILCACILPISACMSGDSKQACNSDNEVLKANEGSDFIEDKKDIYCAIDVNTKPISEANAFVNAGYTAERINKFFKLPYYQKNLTKRYIDYDDKKKNVEDIVTYVNIGLDKPFFTDVDTIKDTKDVTMLINKYHKLPDNYKPDNLVKTPSACTIGKDYSCQSEPQYLVKEVADAYAKLVNAGKKEGITLKAIASYRSYAYQANLYSYYEESEGKEYADQYYARPGQSEHNSGLALDVTFEGTNFNELEKHANYKWLLDNLSAYGFILRYPKDKVHITGYNYESWHLRYVGVDTAKEMQKSGLTLDEYIARKEHK